MPTVRDSLDVCWAMRLELYFMKDRYVFSRNSIQSWAENDSLHI